MSYITGRVYQIPYRFYCPENKGEGKNFTQHNELMIDPKLGKTDLIKSIMRL